MSGLAICGGIVILCFTMAIWLYTLELLQTQYTGEYEVVEVKSSEGYHMFVAKVKTRFMGWRYLKKDSYSWTTVKRIGKAYRWSSPTVAKEQAKDLVKQAAVWEEA